MGLAASIAGCATGGALVGGAWGGYGVAEATVEIASEMGISEYVAAPECDPARILVGGAMGGVVGGVTGSVLYPKTEENQE